MIETIILEYLSPLVGAPVYMEVPPDPPAAYVIVEKVGGRKDEHIDRATVALQSCSTESLYRAACLNEAAKRAMEAITELPDVSRCRLNSDYNFTDKKTKTYRYQAVFDLIFFDS